MATVTISNLDSLTPAAGLVVPVSNGATTGKVTLSQVCGLIAANQLPAGCVIQVVQVYKTDRWSKGGAGTQDQWWDVDGLSVGMTLKKANSKILVSGTINFSRDCSGGDAFLRLLRNDDTSAANPPGGHIGHVAGQIAQLQAIPITFSYLDTPAQATNTYKIQALLSSTACTMFVNVRGGNDGPSFTVPSNLTLMEIAQ